MDPKRNPKVHNMIKMIRVTQSDTNNRLFFSLLSMFELYMNN